MEITQEQLENAGYEVPAAPMDAWRKYDENNPVPGYYQFDWLSSRHPDLYHKFALSSLGLMSELEKQLDLTGLEVLDIGAGTGRITLAAAKKAKRVIAVDPFGSVLFFNRKLALGAGIGNVFYLRGQSLHLPMRDNSVDATICAWAIIDHAEAYRVLKPGGYMIDLIPAPGALCGELTPVLAAVYPEIITEVAPPSQFDPARPDSDSVIQADTWEGVQVTAPTLIHEFTYVADYGDCLEAAAIVGRLFGPRARAYVLDRQQSTLSWRLRIIINRVKK